MKICTGCLKEKEDSQFHFRKDTGKLRNKCIECESKQKKEYRTKNRERLLEKQRIYSRNNLDKRRLYRATHKENEIKNERNRSRTKYNQFRTGRLNLNSTSGQAVITEHVVYTVLSDCVKCNTVEKFTSTFDLISESLGCIDVKSSSLIKHRTGKNLRYEWNFHLHLNTQSPDYYVCLGLGENKDSIQHVWIIPSNSTKVGAFAINIGNSESGLKSAQQYEVDSKPYNDVYQNLNIYELPEFANLKC